MSSGHRENDRMASINDPYEIQSVISRYTNCVNRRDWTVLPAIFAKDAVWTAPAVPDATFEGLAAICQGIPALVAGTTSLIQLNTPSDIAIMGEEATAQCSIRETGSMAAEGIRFEAHGIYDDKLIHVNGAWRFAHRTFTLIENYFSPIATPGAQP